VLMNLGWGPDSAGGGRAVFLFKSFRRPPPIICAAQPAAPGFIGQDDSRDNAGRDRGAEDLCQKSANASAVCSRIRKAAGESNSTRPWVRKNAQPFIAICAIGRRRAAETAADGEAVGGAEKKVVLSAASTRNSRARTTGSSIKELAPNAGRAAAGLARAERRAVLLLFPTGAGFQSPH